MCACAYVCVCVPFLDCKTSSSGGELMPWQLQDLDWTVNSHNEWDALEQVIVGTVEGAMAPPQVCVCVCVYSV
jgi:hypothetical protein